VTAPVRPAALLTAVCIAIALPSVAQAKTKNVSMGVPPKNQKSFQDLGGSANAFFPSSVAINAGDTVRFAPNGFHNVDLPAKGDDPVMLFASTGQAVAGATDAAGAAFWFNGQPHTALNPDVLTVGFGKLYTYRGGKRVNSGLPLGEDPKPMRVKFPKKGTYTYYCNVHAGMQGKVRVKRKAAKVPTAKQDRRRVNKQLERALNTAEDLASKQPPANTAYLGSAGKGGVEFYGMVPATLTVPPGTTVRFAMSPRSYEFHTATFGPGNPDSEPNSYLGEIAASFQGAPRFDPKGVYRSETPGTTAAYTSALHGNGFWNSGILDRSAASPLPASDTVTFTTAGNYTYYCLIHPFMSGSVVVQ
jgi:plastocyanin